jgi:hypothetical protein
VEGEEGEAPLLNNENEKRRKKGVESSFFTSKGREKMGFPREHHSHWDIMLSVTLVWIRRIMVQDG